MRSGQCIILLCRVCVCDFVSLTGRSLASPFLAWCVENVLLRQLAAVRKDHYPTLHADRIAWVHSQLLKSTRGLSYDSTSAVATQQIMSWLDAMVPGAELEHLLSLYRSIDLRGSDARLDAGQVLHAGRQTMPYPSFAWEWTMVQSYSCAVPQHINVLELIACLKLFSSLN